MHKIRFKDICKQIESAYRDSGNALGFRFLYCPKERLKKHNGILVLGLNPGGEKISKDFEVPNGLAYAVEAWGNGKYAISESPIQKQILLLLSSISSEPIMTLASNIVFFRSPSWQALADRKESVAKCIKIWRSIVSGLKGINRVIYIGKNTFNIAEKSELFMTTYSRSEKYDLWAGGSWQIYTEKNGRQHIILPHLSRWRFISNDSPAFEKLITTINKRNDYKINA